MSLSTQLLVFQTRNILWCMRAGSIGLSALSLAFCLKSESPIQKVLLSAFAVASTSTNIALVAAQYHRSNQMTVSTINGQLEGWKSDQLQSFMPPKPERQALPQADIEVVPEEDSSILHRLPDDEIASNIMLAVLSIGGQEIDFLGKQEGLAFDRYLFSPSAGVKLKQIQGKAKDLMINAGLKDEPMISAVPGAIAIDVSRNQRIFAKYEDYIKPGNAPTGLCVPIGVDQLTGELIWIDFTDSNCPHLLVGGATGGGKSELLRAMMLSLIQLSSTSEVNTLLVDTKKSSFIEFKNHSMIIGGEAVTRPIAAAVALIKMVAVVERRQEKREAVGAKDLAAYNKKADKKLPRILVFIEELKDVLDALKTVAPSDLEQLQQAIDESMGADITIGYKTGEMKPRDVLLLAIDRIAQIGRSEGVHLIIATQDPDKKLLDTIISNLPVQVGLKTRSHTESGTLMPGTGAECHKLMGKGDLYLNIPGKPLRRLQSLFADEFVIDSTIETSKL